MAQPTTVYSVAVYEAEEGGYWAEVTDLPGCVAQADTLDDLRANLLDAIAAWLETRREIGDEPEPTRAFTWSIPADITPLSA